MFVRGRYAPVRLSELVITMTSHRSSRHAGALVKQLAYIASVLRQCTVEWREHLLYVLLQQTAEGRVRCS